MRRGTIPCAILKQWVMSAALVGGGCRAPLGGAAYPSRRRPRERNRRCGESNHVASPLLQLEPANAGAGWSIAGTTYAELNDLRGN
jgi:hypothetical protein